MWGQCTVKFPLYNFHAVPAWIFFIGFSAARIRLILFKLISERVYFTVKLLFNTIISEVYVPKKPCEALKHLRSFSVSLQHVIEEEKICDGERQY